MDIAELKQYLNCDNKFLESIIQKFVQESREITATIIESAESGKWEQVKLSAHKMLSSVKLFEIKDLTRLLEKLENEAPIEAKRTELKSDIKNLDALVEKSIEDLQTAFAELD